MKYIVVYIIIILGLTVQNTEAQKTSIDLLPSAAENPHPETLIDTSIKFDSLVLINSCPPAGDTTQKSAGDLSNTPQNSKEYRQEAKKPELGIQTLHYPLIFKSFNPIRFIIHFTALKI